MNVKECTLHCRSFRCANNSFKVVRKNTGEKSFLCTLEDDECIGYFCKYAECREHKMADDGRCLRSTIRKKPSQKKGQFNDFYDDYDQNELDDRLRKKLNKKL